MILLKYETFPFLFFSREKLDKTYIVQNVPSEGHFGEYSTLRIPTFTLNYYQKKSYYKHPYSTFIP